MVKLTEVRTEQSLSASWYGGGVGGTNVYLFSCLFSALDWGQCLELRSGGWTPAENIPGTIDKKDLWAPEPAWNILEYTKVHDSFMGQQLNE